MAPVTPPHRRETDGSPRPKATLFCPVCDHESHADGDWQRRFRRDRVEYVCPACEATITDRPRGSEPESQRYPTTRAVSAWGRFLAASSRAWWAGVSAGTTTVGRVVGDGR